MCLPLLIFPCTINARSSLLAPAHPGGPGNEGHKNGCGVVTFWVTCQFGSERMQLNCLVVLQPVCRHGRASVDAVMDTYLKEKSLNST